MAHYPPPSLSAEFPRNPSSEIMKNLSTQAGLVQQLFSQNETIKESMDTLQLEVFLLDRQSSSAIPTREDLIQLLGVAQVQFGLSLELNGVLRNPVCKGRNWAIDIKLIGPRLPTEALVKVTLYVFSAECPPRMIVANMNGQELLIGDTQAVLAYDPLQGIHCAALKVRFNEVTSHFTNGWVFLAVLPDEANEYLQVTGQTVKPLIVEHFVCKAKASTCSRWREEGKVKDVQPEQNA